jgi:hypothetical protein
MKTIDPFLRAPPSRVAVYATRATLVVTTAALSYFAFFDPNAWVWAIIALISIIVVCSYAFSAFVINSKKAESPLFAISRREYRKQLFPLNYDHLEKDQRQKKFNSNLRSLKEITSLRNSIKRELFVTACLFLSVFFLSTIAFSLHLQWLSGQVDLSESALLALDSIAKGALFDFLESFNVSILGTDPRETFGYSMISLLTRSVVSLIVVREFYAFFRAVQARHSYRATFSDLNSTLDFLFSMRFDLQSWRQSLPTYYGQFPNVENGLPEIMQKNWETSGHSVDNASFEDVYLKFRHRTYKESLEIDYLNVILDFKGLQERAKNAETLAKLHGKAQAILAEVKQSGENPSDTDAKKD